MKQKTVMKFNGSEKQNAWAASIIDAAQLTTDQVDNLLRYMGPKMHARGIMDVTIIIENRHRLSAYATELGRFYQLSSAEKHEVAEEAIGILRAKAKAGSGS